jgi:hypothetical protein
MSAGARDPRDRLLVLEMMRFMGVDPDEPIDLGPHHQDVQTFGDLNADQAAVLYAVLQAVDAVQGGGAPTPIAVLGTSGTGKTTVIRAIMHLVPLLKKVAVLVTAHTNTVSCRGRCMCVELRVQSMCRRGSCATDCHHSRRSVAAASVCLHASVPVLRGETATGRVMLACERE